MYRLALVACAILALVCFTAPTAEACPINQVGGFSTGPQFFSNSVGFNGGGFSNGFSSFSSFGGPQFFNQAAFVARPQFFIQQPQAVFLNRGFRGPVFRSRGFGGAALFANPGGVNINARRVRIR